MTGPFALRRRTTEPDDFSMRTHGQLIGSNVLRPSSPDTYRRDAFICLSQGTTRHQVGLVAARMHQVHPDSPVNSLSDHTLLVQDIPVWASSDHDADAVTWEQLFFCATATLAASDGPAATVSSIDVCATPRGDEE